MHKQPSSLKRSCHRVKLLPAVWHIPSVTTKVNPAHTLILMLWAHGWVCVCVCVFACVRRNGMVRHYLPPLPLWIEGSQPWLHLCRKVTKWKEKGQGSFNGRKQQWNNDLIIRISWFFLKSVALRLTNDYYTNPKSLCPLTIAAKLQNLQQSAEVRGST